MRRLNFVVILAFGLMCWSPGRLTTADQGIDQIMVTGPAPYREIIAGLRLTEVVSDPVQPRVFLGDLTGSSVLVVSTQTDSVVDRVYLDHQPSDLAIEADGSRLYISSREASVIEVLDLSTLDVTGAISVTEPVFDLAAGRSGRLYALAGAWPIISALTINTAQNLQLRADNLHYPLFLLGSHLYVTPDGNDLYVSEEASPGTVGKFDVRGDAFDVLWVCRLSVSATSGKLALSSSGNRLFTPYWGEILSTSQCAEEAALNAGAYTVDLAMDYAHGRVYTLGSNPPVVSVFSESTLALERSFLPPMGAGFGAAIDQSADGNALYLLATDHPANPPNRLWVARPSYLSSTITPALTVVAPGVAITYTVRLNNPDYRPAVPLTATVALPAGVTVLPGSLTGGATLAGAQIIWSGVPTDNQTSFSYVITAPSTLLPAEHLAGAVTVVGGGQASDTTVPFTLAGVVSIYLPSLVKAP